MTTGERSRYTRVISCHFPYLSVKLVLVISRIVARLISTEKNKCNLIPLNWMHFLCLELLLFYILDIPFPLKAHFAILITSLKESTFNHHCLKPYCVSGSPSASSIVSRILISPGICLMYQVGISVCIIGSPICLLGLGIRIIFWLLNSFGKTPYLDLKLIMVANSLGLAFSTCFTAALCNQFNPGALLMGILEQNLKILPTVNSGVSYIRRICSALVICSPLGK